jgi:hypothetical protein
MDHKHDTVHGLFFPDDLLQILSRNLQSSATPPSHIPVTGNTFLVFHMFTASVALHR